jgi:hypothetical protein
MEVQLHQFLIPVLDGSNWLASHIGRFTPKERGPSTHETRDYEYPTACICGLEKCILLLQSFVGVQTNQNAYIGWRVALQSTLL